MDRSFINWFIENNIIKSESELIILFGIISVMLILFFPSFLLNQLKKLSIKNNQNNFMSNETTLFIINKDKQGCLFLFVMSVQLFFGFIFWFKGVTLPLVDLIFLNSLIVFFSIDYIDSFFSKIIVNENFLRYRNLFTLYQYKTLQFNNIKLVVVTSYRGITSLKIIKQKGFPLILANVSDAYNIKQKLDSLIYSTEEIQQQEIKKEKENEKSALFLLIFLSLIPFILFGLYFLLVK